MATNESVLGASVVGSMIGGGVFNLPSDMPKGASPGAIRKQELNAGPCAWRARRSRIPRLPWQRDLRADQVVAALTELRLKGDPPLTTRRAAGH